MISDHPKVFWFVMFALLSAAVTIIAGEIWLTYYLVKELALPCGAN